MIILNLPTMPSFVYNTISNLMFMVSKTKYNLQLLHTFDENARFSKILYFTGVINPRP